MTSPQSPDGGSQGRAGPMWNQPYVGSTGQQAAAPQGHSSSPGQNSSPPSQEPSPWPQNPPQPGHYPPIDDPVRAGYAAEPVTADGTPHGVKNATMGFGILTVFLGVGAIAVSVMGVVVMAILPADFLDTANTPNSGYLPLILGGAGGLFLAASGVTFARRLRLSLYLCAVAAVFNIANAVVGSAFLPFTATTFFGTLLIHLPLIVGLIPKVRRHLKPVRKQQVHA